MRHPIISMVKAVCKHIGVRVYVCNTPGSSFGEYDPGERLLTLYPTYTRPKGRRRGKRRIETVPEHEYLATAVHELTHALQDYRGDSDFHHEVSDYVLHYAEGTNHYPREKLWESAMHTMRFEFEADMMAINILQLFGVQFRINRAIHAAKAYACSYLVFAKTGIMPDYRVTSKWYRYFSSKPEFDVDVGTLNKLIEITRANRDFSYTIWEGRKCIKSIW